MTSTAHQDGFAYLPLQCPSSQIRLLRFTQAPTGVAENIFRCDLVTFDVTDLPDYVAISYTWGAEPKTSSAVSDPRVFHARDNCWHALWQAWNYGVRSYVWIDSICINQLDDSEKSSQVAMMTSIYTHATLVLACVGPCDDESYLVFEHVEALRQRFRDSDSLRSQQEDFFRAKPTSDLIRIGKAMLLLSRRPYFSRLWIVQELFLAKLAIVCCGSDSARFEDLVIFSKALYQPYSHRHAHQRLPQPHAWSWDFLQLCDWFEKHKLESKTTKLYEKRDKASQDLLSTIEAFSYAQCSDIRDHVFGLLGLVDWGDSQPILADYTLGPVDLLQILFLRLRSNLGGVTRFSLLDVVAAMKIGHNHPGITELVRARKEKRVSRNCQQDTEVVADTIRLKAESERCWRLYADRANPACLTVSSMDNHRGQNTRRRDAAVKSTSYNAEELRQTTAAGQDELTAWKAANEQGEIQLRRINSGSGEFAVASYNVRAGDFLVDNQATQQGLILRSIKHRPHMLQIVGQAIFENSQYMRTEPAGFTLEPPTIHWEGLDYLAYIFQDIEYVNEWIHGNSNQHDAKQDIEMLVERLNTPVTKPDTPLSSFATWQGSEHSCV